MLVAAVAVNFTINLVFEGKILFFHIYRSVCHQFEREPFVVWAVGWLEVGYFLHDEALSLVEADASAGNLIRWLFSL